VSGFARRVVAWQRSHGRNGLPWQNTRDPYRVWLSEIMLQQTQVTTVLGYYERFLARFPHVKALAAAEADEVLALWSGLGYYSRARNLHRCAREVVALHAGEFPRNSQALQALPGIGRSTAAAIASFCFGERVAILDGNVKRVLTRVLGCRDDLAVAANERKLWDQAQALLPRRGTPDAMPRYTQGLMDLGATICLARKPSCVACPVHDMCMARAEGTPEDYPVKSRRTKRGAQALWLLRAHAADGSVWLERRPSAGIWGGLHCFPVFESREALQAAVPARARIGLVDDAPFVHVLTHKDLHLHPVDARISRGSMRRAQGAWFGSQEWPQLGLPAPIRRLLAKDV
jgi:A/G-specific adenine glycosylase